jgi:Ca2+-binding RTX toxin-like protein
VVVSLSGGWGSGGDAQGDTLIGIEDVSGSYYGDDWLFGDAGHNSLIGNGGNDTLKGGGGADWLYGGTANDTFYVDSADDSVIEFAGGGNDVVYAMADYTLEAGQEVEVLSLQNGSAIKATGNELSQTIFGNALDNELEGGGGAGSMNGIGGNDTFVFRANQANGSVVYEFQGNGAGAGDSVKLAGFGTEAGGASFTQVSAMEWIIHSGIDGHEEVVTIWADGGSTGATLHQTDFMFV